MTRGHDSDTGTRPPIAGKNELLHSMNWIGSGN